MDFEDLLDELNCDGRAFDAVKTWAATFIGQVAGTPNERTYPARLARELLKEDD